MTSITTISVGFMEGSLWEGADPDAYAAALEDVLQLAYPDARIEIYRLGGYGSAPSFMEPFAAGADGEPDLDAQDAINGLIEVLDYEICRDSEHSVWALAS